MSEKKTESSYKSIFKATSIFGGVQVVNIFISLIRGKAVAMFLGTAGMGLNGLFMSGLNLITTLTSLGVSRSAVRDIAKAHSSNDTVKIRTTFQVFKRLIWFTAILGVITTIAFSPLLSKSSFRDYSHTNSFIWLSVTFIFGALSGGIYTLLRGTRQLKYMAQANILGGISGLIVSLPIFYLYGMDGIVPAIILTAAANYFVSLYFRSKIKVEPIQISWKDTYTVGKPIVQLGVSLTLVTILSSAVAYVLNTFITRTGSLSDLGLFNAGNTIVSSYVGMVFTAMSTDYFPRLAMVIQDDSKWKKLVNEQAELVLVILGIVLVLLISTTPILIRILLSKEFLASQEFIQFAIFSIPLKAIVWVLGYAILAKGNNKLYLTVEITANLIVLFFNILFYHNYGLTGLGVSLCVSYLISSICMVIILKAKYDFKFDFEVLKLTIISIISMALCLATFLYVSQPYFLLAQFAIVLISISYFVYELNKRIKILEVIGQVKDKFIKKK